MVTREYPPFEVGGVAKHTYYLVKHLKEVGVDCFVLSFGNPAYSSVDVFFVAPKSSIISKNDLGIKKDINIPIDIAKLTKVAKKLLSEGNFDLVHVQEPYVGGLITYRGHKVTTIHDTSFGELRGIIRYPPSRHNLKRAFFFIGVGYFMEWVSLANSKLIITPSYEVKKELVEIYRADGNKVIVIPNGVEPPAVNEPSKDKARELLGVGHEDIIIFSTAQHVARKRFDVLIDAIKILVNWEVNRFKVFLGGKGPLTPELRRMVERYGLNDVVNFLGWIPDSKLPLWYKACDIFVITSDYEAGPMTLLEAGIRGSALVSSRIGGFASYMESGVDGLLFTPGNSFELAGKLRTLIEDESLRKMLGNAAIKFAYKFSWRNVALLTKKLYLDVLRN